jgi:O-antigen ligase
VARVQQPQRVLTPPAPIGAAWLGRLLADRRRVLLVALSAGLSASISLSQVTLAVLAAWLVVDWLRGRRRVGAPPLAAPMVAFTVWTVMAVVASPAPRDSAWAARSVLLLATPWIVAHVLDDAARARWFATALFVGMTVVSLLAVVQVGTCAGDRLYGKAVALPPVLASVFGKCARAHGFYSIYMTLGGVLALVLTLTLPRVPLLRPPAAGAAGWLLGVLAFVLTFVRGAWLGCAAGFGVLALLLRRRTLVLLGAVIVIVMVVAVPSVRERATTMFDPADATARERLAMLSAGLTLVRAQPMLGVGPGQVKRLYPEYAPPEALRRHTSHLHNTPLQIAVERGLVGLALWLWIFVAFFVRSARVLRRLPAEAAADRALVAGSIAAIAAFLVAGLFEYNFGDTEVLLVALSIMALPFVVERDHAAAAA